MMYSAQQGMTIDKKSPECAKFLASLLDLLEAVKTENGGNEALTNDLVAQAHIEEYALKMFEWADNQDRSGVFNKNVVKAFYTAGHLLDLLTLFPDSGLDDRLSQQQKYAKWKAAYIHNCLKNGETPVSGPNAQHNAEDASMDVPPAPHDAPGGGINGGAPAPGFVIPAVGPDATMPGGMPRLGSTGGTVTVPQAGSNGTGNSGAAASTACSMGQLEAFREAQKHCKYAISAIEYEDVDTAVGNLQKAIALLQAHK
jgi:vacuolar protein sorting-associated protein VTA1